MKRRFSIIVFLLVQSVSIAFAVGAILLAINGVSGYGWFIVASLISAESYKEY